MSLALETEPHFNPLHHTHFQFCVAISYSNGAIVPLANVWSTHLLMLAGMYSGIHVHEFMHTYACKNTHVYPHQIQRPTKTWELRKQLPLHMILGPPKLIY